MEIIPIVSKESVQRNQIENLEKERKEEKFIGKQIKVPGHTLFSFNKVTGEIKKAKIVKEVIYHGFDKQPNYKSKTLIEKDCFYDQALNKKNFIKRLRRHGFNV